MFAESMVWVRRALGEVVGDLQLLTQSFTGFDPLGLFALGLPDPVSGFEQSINRICRDKNATIVIGKHNLAPCNFKLAKTRDLQCIIGTMVKPLRAGGATAITEDREVDLLQFGSVAMCSPDDDAAETGGLRFQRGQIA